MIFLQKTSEVCKKIAFAIAIMSCLIPAVIGQNMPAQDQGKRYGDPGFVGEPINLNVVNADIRDILNYITEQYGINFVIDKSVKSVPVTVNVNDVPWNVALDSILRAQGLGVQVNGPILRIAEQKTLAEESTIAEKIRNSQLDNSPLYTEFIRLNYARATSSNKKAGFSAGTTNDSSSTSMSGTTLRPDGSITTFTGISTQDGGDGLLPIIKRRLSRRGSIETDSRSNTLIITDVRENIDAIRQLVFLLDKPEPQVEIEARIVVASRNFSRDLGTQLSALVVGNRGQAAVAETDLSARGIVNTVVGLTTGVFGTAQISLLITAGEQKGQAKTIATPRVTAINNSEAEIKSGLKIPITTVQPGSPAGGAVVATTEYVDIPLRLVITPQITDMGTVLLTVTAENSSLAGGNAISAQSVSTEVMVPDGGTTVIGGVLSDDEREEQDRTPGLSNIPLLGNLFKRKGVSRDTSEVLFFITPRIYRPDVNGNQTSGKISEGTRTTTLIQPVPLGNPPSNSEKPTNNPQTVVPVTPVVQPGTNPNNPSNP